MIQGLYAASSGMVAIEQRQATIANNMANANTIGFKRQSAVDRGFYSYFVRSLRRPMHFDVQQGPGGGVRTDETFTDFNAGIFQKTDDPLNLALRGPGYLVVDTPQGERFTRAGALSIDAQGYLITENGHRLQNAAGGDGIDVGAEAFRIDDRGRVLAGGQVAGRLRVVEFEDLHMLEREGHAMYRASDAALERSGPAAQTTVAHEHLEMSNVQVPREMVNMTLGLRAYAANQRVINAIDETMSRLIDQVGSPV